MGGTRVALDTLWAAFQDGRTAPAMTMSKFPGIQSGWMPLSAGDRLGPYEIVSAIGAGGMGEVYKARDGRLDRIVAVKVSKAEFTERFTREARTVAQSNHPNVCTLFDVGPNYLVMEFVEGTPLQGPLPVEKALEYAGQILDALDAAHRKGIIPPRFEARKHYGHETEDQAPRFRIGQAIRCYVSGGGRSGRRTRHYMAPEQLEGKPADARSDIFAFGLILYELISVVIMERPTADSQ